MKIVIFGVGQMYKERRDYIFHNDEIVAFLDNNQELWESEIDGIIIYRPDKISEINFDKIILMSIHALEMKKQLLSLGCNKKRIMHYSEYMDYQYRGEMKVSFPVNGTKGKEGCLIITTAMGYNGGTIAAVYAALALRIKGHKPIIASPECDSKFMEELKKYEIGIIIYKNLSHADRKELFWVDSFRYVIVNTLQMSCCAIEIAKSRKVILWIHEPRNIYEGLDYWKDIIQEGIYKTNLKIYAVSSVAKNNFLKNFTGKSIGILPYGIPDRYIQEKEERNGNCTFAMIGLLSEQKGQDLFLEAIKKLNEKENNFLFLIIGKNLEDTYGNSISEKVKQYSNVQLLGEMSHESVMKYWKNIDVLVVSSREDMLPIVATESMMLGKVCIVSDIVGTANYITNYVNGLIVTTENTEELAERLLWCVEHKKMLRKIGESARKLYKQNFSMEVFGENLEKVIKQ